MESFVFPGNIEPEISLIASRPIPYMRTAAFSAVVKSSEQMLLHLIGCPTGKVIFYTASGTGAMDAVVANYVSRYKKIFIISGGSFGDRWKNICDYYNLSSTLYKIPFAKDIDYEDLEKRLHRNDRKYFFASITKHLQDSCLIWKRYLSSVKNIMCLLLLTPSVLF